MSRANHYDVVIIGAGSVGVPAAMSMAKSDLNVLVLEQASSPGQGSNKSAIGGIRATHSDPAKIRLGLRSLEIASTWKDVYRQDIEWTTGGYTFVAYRQQEKSTLKNLLKIQHKYGLNIDWHNKDSLLDIVPDLNHTNLIGGSFSPNDGHCSPLLFNHAIYEQATRAGADFRFSEAVEEIILDNDKSTGVKTNKGTYSCNVVLNAAGAFANKIGDMVGIAHNVSPDSHEAGITEPVAHFLDPMVVDIRPAPGSANCYFYQLATGQIVFCITPDPKIPGLDCNETSRFLPMVSRRVTDLMPKLTNIRVRRTWRGLYPMTEDGSPLVGWSDKVEGYLMAIGMCGQGFMLGPGLGELLTRMVTDNLSADDQQVLEILSPYRKFAGQEALK